MIGDLDRSWHRLEVRHLVALDAVLRSGSFRAAARALGYSQSAVSEQIAALEAIVGARVVERSPGARAVRPTEAGAIVLRCAEHVSDVLAGCRADLSASATGGEVIRLGIFPSASVRLLPPIVQALRVEHPGLQLVLAESVDPEALFRSVAAGELDVAFGSPSRAPAALETATLFDDPYVLLVAADNPLGQEAAVRPAEVARLPLIGYRSLRPGAPAAVAATPSRTAPRGIPNRRRPDRTRTRSSGSRRRCRPPTKRRSSRPTGSRGQDRPPTPTTQHHPRLATRTRHLASAQRLHRSSPQRRRKRWHRPRLTRACGDEPGMGQRARARPPTPSERPRRKTPISFWQLPE